MTPAEIQDWPGKEINGNTHPALWHMLDVGAVASSLLKRRSLTGCNARDQAAVFLVTLHDIGKFSMSFRKMLLGEPYLAELRHWQHSYRILLKSDDQIAFLIGARPSVRKTLYAAVAGHHGGPPEHLDHRRFERQLRQIGPKGIRAAKKAIAAISGLFPDASLEGMTGEEAQHLSWKLSGLTVQADWIGSNTEWFGVQPSEKPIETYWEQGLARAEKAIEAAGLHGAQPRPAASVAIIPDGSLLRPMQAAVSEIALPAGPTLALIEDATGAGKTEAALILAVRMMAAGKGGGFFFALPTMATSNAMLERLDKIVPGMFDGRPSLALTHSKARMNQRFREILGQDGSDPGEPVTCGKWLANDRRRVLLADVGVGTIDQTLMAILPTRFNTLRLWALSGRILIVDEAP